MGAGEVYAHTVQFECEGVRVHVKERGRPRQRGRGDVMVTL